MEQTLSSSPHPTRTIKPVEAKGKTPFRASAYSGVVLGDRWPEKETFQLIFHQREIEERHCMFLS